MQIRSFEEYKNLTDYSQKLNAAINKIKACPLTKKPKQISSFEVTLTHLQTIMNDMIEIQRLLNNIASIPVMDLEAKKTNKTADKVDKIIRSIKKELRANFDRLQNEFLKQFKIAKEQCIAATRKIDNIEEKKNYTNHSLEFQKMATEAQSKNFKLPFNKSDEMEEVTTQQRKSEHEEKTKQIDDTTKEIDNTDELTVTIERLSEALALAPQDKQTNAIRKEFIGIKKAKPQKMIAAAKHTLDQLRHSQQLSLDIEQITAIMGGNARFLGNDKKLQKVADQIQNLKSLLKKAKESEEKRYDALKEINGISYGIVKEATEAAQEYISELETGNSTELPIRYTNIKGILKQQSALLRKKQKEHRGVTR